MERKSVSYEHEGGSMKLTPKDTMVLVFDDEFEYSCVVQSVDEKDPTLIFDTGLMTFLAEKGYHVAKSIKKEVPEYVLNGYAKFQANQAEIEWMGMVAVNET